MHDDDCDHEAVHKLVFEGRAAVAGIRELDWVIEQFGAGTKAADRRLVARALYGKAKTFALAGKHGDAVTACSAFRARSAHDDDAEVLQLKATTSPETLKRRNIGLPPRVEDCSRCDLHG